VNLADKEEKISYCLYKQARGKFIHIWFGGTSARPGKVPWDQDEETAPHSLHSPK